MLRERRLHAGLLAGEQPVPAESFERLLAVTADDPPLRAYLLCGWLAGLRRNEAYHLEREPSDRWPWVDWPNDRVVLPAEFAKSTEDGWVPLDPVLRAALEALPRQGRKVFRFDGGRGELTPSGVGQRIVALAKRAGVRLTMRSLRRGFACRYAALPGGADVGFGGRGLMATGPPPPAAGKRPRCG